MDVEDQIPPTLPCLPAGRLYKREEFPLFDNRFPVVRQAKSLLYYSEDEGA
jgi:hypothetical protein